MALSNAERQAAGRARNTAIPDFFQRAAYVAARHAANPGDFDSPERVAKSLWPSDDVTPLLVRAASLPATTSTTGWASDLSPPRAGDFVGSLVPLSAAARLIDASTKVSLTGANALIIPHRQSAKPSTDVQWVSQAGPIGVRPLAFDSVGFGPPHKLGTACVLTRELVNASDGERIVGLALREDVAASLDASMFSSAAPALQPKTSRPGGSV
jgi:hypothetical protein